MVTQTLKEPDLHASWKAHLRPEFESTYFASLKKFLLTEKAQHVVYPPGKQIFSALNRTPLDKVKVVIIGQDPYHGPGQANGLCFSVNDGIRIPPSLKNIFKEIESDLGHPVPKSGNLEKWADQGVLLLNATLTVRAHSAGSHQGKGWERFTDQIIRTVSAELEGVVFILWGRFAQMKSALVDTNKHRILKSVHPSPLSAHNGYFGCKHFSKTNEILKILGKSPIDWQLE